MTEKLFMDRVEGFESCSGRGVGAASGPRLPEFKSWPSD